MKIDPNFKAIRNEGPNRLGHTILYDKLINEVNFQQENSHPIQTHVQLRSK